MPVRRRSTGCSFLILPGLALLLIDQAAGIYVISFSYEEITRPKKPSLVLYPPPNRLA